MGMACSSEVRAAAAIAEDVGFDSLPCPQFSDSFLIWCPHHSWVSNNHSKTSQKLMGLLGLLFTVYDSCRYQGRRGWRILDKTNSIVADRPTLWTIELLSQLKKALNTQTLKLCQVLLSTWLFDTSALTLTGWWNYQTMAVVIRL